MNQFFKHSATSKIAQLSQVYRILGFKQPLTKLLHTKRHLVVRVEFAAKFSGVLGRPRFPCGEQDCENRVLWWHGLAGLF